MLVAAQHLLWEEMQVGGLIVRSAQLCIDSRREIQRLVEVGRSRCGGRRMSGPVRAGGVVM